MGKPAADMRLFRAPMTSLRVMLSTAGAGVAAEAAVAPAAVALAAAPERAKPPLATTDSDCVLPTASSSSLKDAALTEYLRNCHWQTIGTSARTQITRANLNAENECEIIKTPLSSGNRCTSTRDMPAASAPPGVTRLTRPYRSFCRASRYATASPMRHSRPGSDMSACSSTALSSVPHTPRLKPPAEGVIRTQKTRDADMEWVMCQTSA